jgi:hypothetical protein
VLARNGKTFEDPTGDSEPKAQQLALVALAGTAVSGLGLAGERAGKPLLRVVDRHVFYTDVVTCLRSGGPTRWLEAATTPEAMVTLRAKHGLGPRPPASRAAPTGHLHLFIRDRVAKQPMPTAPLRRL